MSTARNRANPNSLLSQTAEIRLVARWLWPQSGYKLAYVLVSSRIYWKVANKDRTNKPQSIADFRNVDSIELVRLNHGTWNNVDGQVKVDRHNGRMRIVVSGRSRGRTRRNNALLVPDVQLEIIATTAEQYEMWLNQIRSRIAPWNLLQQEVKETANRASSLGVEELEKVLRGLTTSGPASKLYSTPTNEVEETWRDYLDTLPAQMQKLSFVDDLTAHGTAAVETGATLAKFVASVERVAEAAEVVADVSKCVSGVSTLFHLLALSAHGVSMWAEANRGRRALPVALGEIVILLRYVLESMTEVMKQSRGGNLIDQDFVFDVLKGAVGAMDMAETQLLRGRGSEMMNAENVKEVEKKLEELRHKVVTAGNTARICAVDNKVNQLEEDRKNRDDGPHHVRPPVSAFFSGRKKELNALEEKLKRWGSAVVTRYGGMGKTELMIAFADRAERDEQVPGGVFWVTVDGSMREVIRALAELAEKLTRKKMSEDERRNTNLVVTTLKEGLSERQGRWLLCLDNADDSKVRGILNEVCGLAEPSRGNGWVVVTSRQGHPRVWAEMNSDQKLILEPLCVEDAMVALWRRSQMVKTSDREDDVVMKEIEKLEGDDEDEYRALKELCGDDGAYNSLGGLPLAIVQAGTYIDWFDCSFGEYLNMFKKANRREEFEDIMTNTEEVKPIEEWQRSIWTTWKISVEQLSEKAYMVLGAMAMLGQGGIEEGILNGILEAATGGGGVGVEGIFRKVIVKELMHGSSLIWCDKGEEAGGRRMFRIHRLVQLFIQSDVGRGTKMWNNVHRLALLAVHQDLGTELEKQGNSLDDLPDMFNGKYVELAAHSLALVRNYVHSSRGNEIQNVSEVEDIHRYTGRVMGFIGKFEEEVEVWEDLLAILHDQQADNRRKGLIKRLHDVRYRRKPGKEVERRIACTYRNLGCALMHIGKLNKAASKLEQSLEMERAIHGHHKPHPDLASSLNNLGLVYHNMGKLEKALEMYEQSLEMERAIHGSHKPHPDVAMSLNNIGNVYYDMGELSKALEKHKECLEIKRAIHGHRKPHPDLASSLNNLGLVYRDMGELEKALEKHEQSLEMERAIHGPHKQHPKVASSLSNLGLVYRDMGELDKALEKCEESLEMKRAVHGRREPHPDVAMSLNNLGSVYHDMGELNEALQKHEESLEMYRAIHGPCNPHPDVAMALNNLGLVYHDLGELEKALEKYEQSLEMKRAIHGRHKPHPGVAMALNNLGLVYHDLGELEKALEKYEQSLEMKRAIHGRHKPHPGVAMSLNNLGNVYRDMSELEKALEKHEESLEVYRGIHGPRKSHPDVASSLNNLGNVYHRIGELEKALEKHEESLEMYRAIHGQRKPHPDVAMSLNNLGNVYHDMGELEKALEKYEKSLEMKRAIYGPCKLHPDVAMSLNNLGSVYYRMGELEKALETYEQSLEMKRAIYGPRKPHPGVAMSLNNLGLLYHDVGELEKALEKLEQSLEMYRAIHGLRKPHLGTALSLCGIGMVYHEQKKLDRAADFLERSLEMLRIVHGQSSLHPHIKAVECVLAIVRESGGGQEEALTMVEGNTRTDGTRDSESSIQRNGSKEDEE